MTIKISGLGKLQPMRVIGFALFSLVMVFANAVTVRAEGVDPDYCTDRDITITPQLIEEGRQLFINETFGGNGRTCTTCHRPENNFTIDPAFISSLYRKNPLDPLFVAEFNVHLAGLENPEMMHRFGLILENLDGFDKPGVLRSVPHTLGLSQTIGNQDNTDPRLRTHETGWSADGTPGDGSLRCFAAGAIKQHFTKTLNRIAGTDFQLPTNDQLDAMLAFQLSIGNQSAPAVSTLNFLEEAANRGRTQFFGIIPIRNSNPAGRNCAGCHVEAGANNAVGIGNSVTAFRTRNRITSVNYASTAPICRTRELGLPDVPGDGGFGKSEDAFTHTLLCGSGSVDVTSFIGDTRPINANDSAPGFFNVPPLQFAADTGPFFHNNAFDTLEEAIGFYSSDEFNDSLGNSGRGFVFGPTDVVDIGAFLRALNAMENAHSAADYIEQSMLASTPARAEELLRLSLADTEDGIEVLTNGPRQLFIPAVVSFRQARGQLTAAIASGQLKQAALAQAYLEGIRSQIVANPNP